MNFPRLIPLLQRAFPWMFAAFLLHFFLVSDGNIHLHSFWLVVGIPALLRVHQQGWKEYLCHPLFLAVLAYGIWFAGTGAMAGKWRGAMDLLAILAFTLAVLTLRRNDAERVEKGLAFALLAVGAVAALSLIIFYSKAWIFFSSHRLEALGELDHPIKAAAVYGLFGLMAFVRLIAPSPFAVTSWPWNLPPFPRWFVIGGGVLLPLAVVMLATQGRGAMLGMMAGGVVALLLARRFRLLAGGIAAMLALIGLMMFAFHGQVAEKITSRGESYRFSAWEQYLGKLQGEEWIYGEGIANRTIFPELPGVIHPHSLYVSHLYYGGTIGLVLFLALLAVAVYGAWQSWRKQGDVLPLALLACVLVMGLVDFPHMLGAANAPWLFFWLPVLWAGSGAGKENR